MAVKIGFIGCGGIANSHMRSLAQIKDAQMVAFCDLNKERAEAAAKKFGGEVYTNYRTMYQREDLDAVYICIPPFAHTDQEIRAAQQGIHLFVEKPVAGSLKKAKQIEAAIKKSRIISSVGYHFRYMNTTQKAKQILSNKKIGMVLGYWMGGLPGVYWWRRKELSGGQMVEQTTHIFDLARYFAGDVKKVHAAYASRLLKRVPKLNIPDLGTTILEFENGAIGTITSTCSLSQGYKVGLAVTAKDLVLEIMAGELKVIGARRRKPISGDGKQNLRENRAFVKAVKTGERSGILSPYSDGVKTLVVTLAANEAARTGKAVRVKA